MKIIRKKTREIKLGSLGIGGSNRISVQSMTKSNILNSIAIRAEINELIECGCEVIRIAIPDKSAVSELKKLIDSGIFRVPVVADIHFDCTLAIDSIKAGVSGIRINPGNIGGRERTAKVIDYAKKNGIAVRLGINSGSVDKKILRKNNGNIKYSMIESTIENIKLFENLDFYNFKISAKASSVIDTISVYRTISEKCRYPLHIGVTEAGPMIPGTVKSSVGLGILLAEGIGDTIRVSLTDKSSEEVKIGYLILDSLGLRNKGVNIVSCPTCGRTTVDLQSIVKQIEEMTGDIKKGLKLAVMGCIVNGPGEAKDADLGIAFGKDRAAIFLKGSVIKRVKKDNVLKEFKNELEKLL
jgi:(E)-4-hydroxy-3-methylbut-2-enyl-diphosphate synthase